MKTQTISTLEIAEMLNTERWKVLRKFEEDKRQTE